mmetsp:Transcript_12024/g.21447  ORF Transcript_12024/g.21447 Transcript_12024/m.21447 type:complete len:232 (-) Transcript_12024:329-1024(-)
MQLALVSKVLSTGQCQTRGNDTLNGGVVRQVHEQCGTRDSTRLSKVGAKVASGLHVDTHSTEYHSKVIVVVIGNILTLHKTSLASNLGTNLVVRKTSSREQRDLLSTSDRVHDIYSRDTGLDHLFGVCTRVRVDGFTLDIEKLLSKHGGSLIDSLSGSVKGTAKHLFGDGHLEYISGKAAVCSAVIDTTGSFKDLYNSTRSVDFQHLTLSGLSVAEREVYDLTILGKLYVL